MHSIKLSAPKLNFNIFFFLKERDVLYILPFTVTTSTTATTKKQKLKMEKSPKMCQTCISINFIKAILFDISLSLKKKRKSIDSHKKKSIRIINDKHQFILNKNPSKKVIHLILSKFQFVFFLFFFLFFYLCPQRRHQILRFNS